MWDRNQLLKPQVALEASWSEAASVRQNGEIQFMKFDYMSS